MDVMIRTRTCGAQTFTARRNGNPAAWRPALPLPLCPYGLDYI